MPLATIVSMIVNYTVKGWEIITQRAHGLLAAQLAWRWKEKKPAGRWLETILAIADHDDTCIEFEDPDLLTDAGGPVNYSMRAFDAEHCKLLSVASLAKSRYIALLSGMHLLFLYGKEARKNAHARVLLDEQRKLVVSLRRQLGLSAAEVQRTYAFMQWCDALSLLICQNALQPEQRMTEISQGPDKRSYEICQLGPNKLSVRPWPFDSGRFTVTVESRVIAQLAFESTAAFKKALQAAPVKEIEYLVVK